MTNQGAFEQALQAELTDERDRNAVLTDQLRAANLLNEGLAYKLDFMHGEVARVTASREQYERVAIRVSAKMEAATSMVMGQLSELQEEIRQAAFTKPAEPVEIAPTAPAEPPSYDGDNPGFILDYAEISRTFGAGFSSGITEGNTSASLLPAPRFGNGAVKP